MTTHTKKALTAFIIELVLGAAIGLIAFFALISPAVGLNASYKENVCVYDDCRYDFIAPTPADEQVDELASAPCVAAVYPYYSAQFKLSAKKQTPVTAYFSAAGDREITFFNKRRLITEKEVAGDALAIDNLTAAELGVTAGDRVTLGSAEFTVSAVYLTDGRIGYVNETKLVMFTLTDALKEKLGLGELTYRGVFIEANDKSAADAMLRSYIPLGGMLTPDYFDSSLGYEDYVAEYKRQNHYNKVTKKDNLLGMAEKHYDYTQPESDTNIALAVLVVGLGTLAIGLVSVIFWYFYDKRYSRATGFGGKLKLGELFGAVALGALGLFAGALAVCYIGTAATTGLYLFADGFAAKLWLFPLLGGVIGLAFTLGAGYCVARFRK